jgi:hypothetical protein
MRPTLTLEITVAASLCATGVRSESLGDVAARERARRAQQAGQAKTYTDGDLDRTHGQDGGPAGVTGTAGIAAASPVPGQAISTSSKPEGPQQRSTADSDYERRRQEQAGWQRRASDLRRKLAAARTEATRLESETNAAVTSSVSSCTPSPHRRGRAARAADQLAAARQQVAALEQAVIDLEEEARRARVPPGWLRE